MSWFGNFVGGLVEGVGKGGSAEAEYRDKLDAQRELQAERLLERRESQQARLDQQRELALMRAETARGNRRGGGGAFTLFDLAQEAKTPEQQRLLVESVRAEGGDDAANVVSRIFGANPGRMADPARESVSGYTDATGGMETAVPSQVQVGGMSADAAKRGNIAIQRVLARARGKVDDYEKGTGQGLVNDAVRGAGGDDAKLRAAGATAMAVEGKDRIGVQGDQVIDKAGVAPVKQTTLGDAKAADERASAAKNNASARDGGREIKTKEFQALQQERISIDSDLKRAEDTLKALRKERPAGMTKEQHKAEIDKMTAKIDRWEADKATVQARIRDYTTAEGERGRGNKPPPAGTTGRKVGEKQVVQSGPNKGKTAVWDGKGWKLQ